MRIPGLALTDSLDGLPWRSTAYEGVEWIALSEREPEAGAALDGTVVALIRMAPGRGYPAHRHIGAEDVLVLAGGYADQDGRTYAAGEWTRYGPGSSHTPTAVGDPDRPAGPSNPACILYAVAHGGTERVAAAQSSAEESR